MNRRQTFKLVAGAFAAATSVAALGRPMAAFAQQGSAAGAPAAFQLPALGYAYDALEPHIDTATMQFHHRNHHNAFIGVLNTQAEKFPDLAKQPIETFLANLANVPEGVRTPVRNAGGGHWNHTFFWNLMTPGGAKGPTGDLATAINGTFGSQDKMIEAFNAAAVGRFGSGWAWLAVDKDKKLRIMSTPNQDTPHMDGHRGAVIGIDVWEHAYYLKHQYRRADYVKAWWNTVNWDKAAASFKQLTA
jgi:Fe-Mn family superoxide dismutase